MQYERIDIEENPEVADKYGVSSVPVVLLLDGENVIYQVIGFNIAELNKLIELSK